MKAKDTDGVYAKILKNLTKIEESKRPRNRKTLRQHVKTLAGRLQTEQKLDQIIEQLFATKVVTDGDGGLVYKV
jgi:hypothetical protein